MLEINFSIHWITLLIIVIAFLLLNIYIIWRIVREDYKHDPYIAKQWAEILEMWESKKTSSYKLAIIEADKLMDYVFKKMQLVGKDFGERLRGGCHKYPFMKELWFSHNLRNDIVHKSHFELSSYAASKALRIYRRSLKKLGYIK